MAAANGTISLNSGTITNQMISAAAADTIASTKLQHIYDAHTSFGLVIGGTPANAEYIVYVANTSGTISNFQALCNATGSSSSVTFDLLKNGTTVLTSAITITNANSNRQVVTGTLSSTSYSAGDVFSMKLVISTTTGMTGPYAWARFTESVAA